MFLRIRQPSVLQKLVFNLVHLKPSGFSGNSTEHVVIMSSRRPVKDSFLRGSGNPARECLISVDVFNAILVLVVIDIKGDGSIADSRATDPGHTLHAQDGIDVIAQGLVLAFSSSKNRKANKG